MIMEINKAAEFLKNHDNYLILTHSHPDGDTLGSAGALCHALRRCGKCAYLYRNPEITKKFVEYVGEYLAPEGFVSDTIISTDVPDPDLFPVGFDGKVDLAFDHHPTNSHFASELVLGSDKASCGEIITQAVKQLCGDIDKTEADLLYMAVSTDTGCFMYANTKADTFITAAELVKAGAALPEINKKMFRTFSRARLELEGYVFTHFRSFRNGTINVAVIPYEVTESTGITENDCDDIASLAGRLEGSLVNITVRETSPGNCKISVRSGKELDSAALCRVFGGGGHVMAAGCRIKCGCDEAVARVVAEAQKALDA